LCTKNCLCDVGLRMFLLIVIFFVTPVNLRKEQLYATIDFIDL
jgi:hypothetical protein